MTISIAQISRKYPDRIFDPMEFICRKRIRADKKDDVERAKDNVIELRQLLFKELSLFQESKNFKITVNVKPKLIADSGSFFSRCIDWINGAKYENEMKQANYLAVNYKADAVNLGLKMKSVDDLYKKYMEAIQHFSEVAIDAAVYDAISKTGWTWWR